MAFSSAEIHRNTTSAPWTYADLDRRQQELRELVFAGRTGKLILSEVAPVVTLGLRNTNDDLLLTPDVFAKAGVSIYRASRGGRATYHGPGQWLAFPVESLERISGDRKGVRKTTEILLESALSVCRLRFPHAEIREGKEAGVWSDAGAKAGKVVAMGLRFEGGVLQHGLSLNVFRTPESFFGIRPCGLDAPVAFLVDEPSTRVRESVFIQWGERFEKALLDAIPCLR